MLKGYEDRSKPVTTARVESRITLEVFQIIIYFFPFMPSFDTHFNHFYPLKNMNGFSGTCGIFALGPKPLYKDGPQPRQQQVI